MIPSLGKPDRLLRRFCRTGDPAALGALFDRTAPELLRAALWLCGDKNDAEEGPPTATTPNRPNYQDYLKAQRSLKLRGFRQQSSRQVEYP